MKWDDSYRKLFFDFHNWAENHSLAADFDGAEFARQVDEVGCEMVSVFCIGGKGHRYYRKGEYGVIHSHLPAGVDMVEDVVHECHKRNIKVLGYTGYGMTQEFLLNEHPEFIQTDQDGTYSKNPFSGIRACKIGYATDYLIKQYIEIVTNYDLDWFFVDGSYVHEQCFCPSCKEKFNKEMGRELPTVKEGQEWKDYLNWFHRKMEEHRSNVRDALHKARPGIKVIINWSNTYRSPDPAPSNVDILFGDVPFRNELEGIDMCARSFALTGMPYEIHNTAFLKSWGEWGLKHPNVLKRAAALLLANGTNVHMGYQFPPRFPVDQGVWDTFKEVFEWVKPREPYLKNNEIKPFIGAYYSSLQHGLTHTGEIWSEPRWLYGFNKLMIDSGLHYNMLGSEHMARTIKDFAAVFLPDMRFISSREKSLIEDYVREGGTLIATGLTGTANDMGDYTGSCCLSDMLGIKWEGITKEKHSYFKILDSVLAENTSNMKLTMEAASGQVSVKGAEKLAALYDLYYTTDGKYAHRYSPAQDDTGYAAITCRQYGKGWAIYFSHGISEAYYHTFQWNLAEIIKNLLFKKLNIDERVKVTGDGSVEVTLAERDGHTQIHLVNMAGTQPPIQHVDGYCMPREIVTMADVSVSVMAPEPKQVILRPQNEDLPFDYKEGKVSFIIPRMGLYEIVELI